MITLSTADVNKTFKQVNIHKAAGPDGLPASFFTDIFNLSLSASVIPTCYKQTTIVHVPKNTKVTCLNDYRPIALTSEAMQSFERLVMAHINTIIQEILDPLQFAYRPNRSTDDVWSAISSVERNLYCAPHCPFTPGQKEHPCENAIH